MTSDMRTAFSIKLIIPHQWGKTLLSSLPNALWITRFSYLSGGPSTALCECQSLFPLILSNVSSKPQLFSSHTCAHQYPTEYSNGTLSRSLNSLSPCSSLLSGIWSPELQLSWSPPPYPTFIFPIQGVHQVIPGFLYLYSGLNPLSRQWAKTIQGLTPWGFPPFKDHCPPLTDAPCFSYISSCFLVVSYTRVKPALVIPSRLEAEVVKVYLIC